MTLLDVVLVGVISWAWIWPDNAGEWAAKAVHAYRKTLNGEDQ